MIHQITEQAGAHRKRKRIGRGPGSGNGKTAGRGHKGARSRSGYASRTGDEGGQMPLFRRLPKRGFSNARFRTVYAIVNLKAIDARFDDGAEVNPETLVRVGLIKDTRTPVKVLAQGETAKKFSVTAAAFSQAAIEKIQKAGGAVTVAS